LHLVENPYSIFDSDFPLHLTLEKDIPTADIARTKFIKSKNLLQRPIFVTFEELYHEFEDNFAALYYFVKVAGGTQPDWWDENAHISLAYDYNQWINITEEHEALQGVVVKLKVSIYYCNNHYQTWYEVEQ